MSLAKKQKFILLLIVFAAFLAANLAFPGPYNKVSSWMEKNVGFSLGKITRQYKFGLDLQGGTHLVYEADLSKVKGLSSASAMSAVRDVIERRVNLYGISEPVVQVAKVGNDWRLIVELAGVKDVNKAIEMIGQTPALDFREERTPQEKQAYIQLMLKEYPNLKKEELEDNPLVVFKATNLNGSYLKGSKLVFDPKTFEPTVTLSFNKKGSKIFAQLTKRNVGKRLAIFLDNAPISAPVVREEIPSGEAVISGNFTVKEAKTLVERLNAGALPVPIHLVNQMTIGATLGQESLKASLRAAILGMILVVLFMILYYRLPGVLAVVALIIYTVFILAIYKILPVTLTLAGIAGFILSVGMAVDANILIFERIKEEMHKHKILSESIVNEGFRRAWTSIRDANVSTLITALFLYMFGTSFVKGFALTLGIGIVVSVFTAVFVTRLLLLAVTSTHLASRPALFKCGFGKMFARRYSLFPKELATETESEDIQPKGIEKMPERGDIRPAKRIRKHKKKRKKTRRR